MNSFVMNGYLWRIMFVHPNSPMLRDRTGVQTVATTDPSNFCLYLSSDLEGDFLTRVLLHELGHCAMVSFGLLDDIHRMVKKKYWIEAEEWVCNVISNHARQIFELAYDILGDDVRLFRPYGQRQVS